MKKVQLKLNESNLIANLGHSFTSKQVLFRELAQNSRRAGASKIELTLDKVNNSFIIKDDGLGIKEFQNLFTVAESGWDSETQAKENPFGMGFLMAIFSCTNLKVESCGQELNASKFDILEKRELNITPGKIIQGTIITLSGLEESFLNVRPSDFAGFPIPVIVDGEELARPHSMEALSKNPELTQQDFWFGTAFLGVEHGYGKMFLQGQPLEHHSKLNSVNAVIHLKSDEFKARMPDRMNLIDEDEQIEKIKNTIFEYECEEIKKKKDDYNYLFDNYVWVKKHNLLDLFNAFDQAPNQFFRQTENAIATASENTEEWQLVSLSWHNKQSIPKKELMNRKVLSHTDFSYSVDPNWNQEKSDVVEFVAHLFMHEQQVLVIDRDCPKGHWAHNLAMDSEAFVESISVKVNEPEDCNIESNFTDYPIVMAKSYSIETKLGNMEVDYLPCVLWNEKDECAELVIPFKGMDGGIINQVCRFRYDDYINDNIMYECESNFEEWASLETASRLSDEKMLEVKMQDFLREMPSLNGKAFRVSFMVEEVREPREGEEDLVRKVNKVIIQKQ